MNYQFINKFESILSILEHPCLPPKIYMKFLKIPTVG